MVRCRPPFNPDGLRLPRVEQPEGNLPVGLELQLTHVQSPIGTVRTGGALVAIFLQNVSHNVGARMLSRKAVAGLAWSGPFSSSEKS
jgi:hypothetical protein